MVLIVCTWPLISHLSLTFMQSILSDLIFFPKNTFFNWFNQLELFLCLVLLLLVWGFYFDHPTEVLFSSLVSFLLLSTI